MRLNHGLLRLSSHLLEATNDTKYLDAATLSSDFIKNQMYNGQILDDLIEIGNCGRNPLENTYNQGIFIEGLSVFADYTKSTTWKHL